MSQNKLLQFVLLIGKLKVIAALISHTIQEWDTYRYPGTTRRTGWVQREVKHPESIADHMYRMAILSFMAKTNANLDREKCIKISLIHDMAESIVGDITPSDGISKEVKHLKEKDAMNHIQTLLDEDTGSEFYSLWLEYEEQSSSEAKFVKDLDKFDMIMQAYEYEQADSKPGFLQDFFDSTQGKFQTPEVQGWVDGLYKLRAVQSKDHPSGENTPHKPT